MELPVLIMVIIATTLTGARKVKRPNDRTTCSGCISANREYGWCSKESYTASRCQPTTRLTVVCKMHVESPAEKHLEIRKNRPLRPKRPISPQKVNLELRIDASAELPIEVFSQKESVLLKFRHPRAVKVKVVSNCTGFEWKNKLASCNGISRGKVHFKVIATMRKCLRKPKKIKVIVDGNRRQSLKIFLKSTCSCECENNAIISSPLCNGHGDHTCGICICHQGYYGEHCACDAAILSEEESTARCKRSKRSSVCLGRGRCICGVCECDSFMSYGRVFTGPYCDCDSECERYNGENCGGAARGVCKCGKCQCLPGYTGTACNISTATDNCIATSGIRPPVEILYYNTQRVCNGQGSCINNRCECQKGYAGPTCEECRVTIISSPLCNGHGDHTCGRCICHQGYYGDHCECDAAFVSEEESIARCKMSERSSVCSARGRCICGVCECDSLMSYGRVFTGPYCDCDSECERYNGENCGGPARGVCQCGTCHCLPGYTGTACNISTASDNCISTSGRLCNGQGSCINNRCTCQAGYIGPTCEECPTCPGKCVQLKPCAQCVAFATGPLTQEQCYTQCRDTVSIVDSIDERERGSAKLRRCMFRDEDACLFNFGYKYEDNQIQVKVERTRLC